MSAEESDLSIPSSWSTPPLKLADDSEFRVSAQQLKDDSEIRRLSELAESIPGRFDRAMPFEPGDHAGYKLGFPYSRGV